MFIKIDPLNHMDLPEIKFMGSDIEVESKTDLVSKNLNVCNMWRILLYKIIELKYVEVFKRNTTILFQKWDPSCDIKNNLMTLLDIDAFPKREIKKEEIDYNVIVTDEECCICFSLKLDNETLPDKICNNEKCRRHFHTSCLLQVYLYIYKY